MPVSVKKKSNAEWLQEILDDYLKETGKDTFAMPDVARWAIKRKRWQPTTLNIEKQCARELARAARDQYYTDPSGRRVRRKHAVRMIEETADGPKQYVLWGDILTAPPAHMQRSLQQRRVYILRDCEQLKTDLDSYNEFNKHGAHIQFSFNFAEDLEELAHPTEYPDTKPGNQH